MTGTPQSYYWKDKCVDNLSREEAIDALKQSIKEVYQAYDRAQQTHKIYRFISEARQR